MALPTPQVIESPSGMTRTAGPSVAADAAGTRKTPDTSRAMTTKRRRSKGNLREKRSGRHPAGLGTISMTRSFVHS